MAKIKARIQPTELDKAYIAGLIDGEGSIAVYKTSPKGGSHRLQVMAKMCDWAGIDFISSRYDCTVSFYFSNLDKVVHKFWMGNGQAYQFLKDIRPYMRVKAEQADVGLKFFEDIQSVMGEKLTDEQVKLSEECCQLLKDLKVIHPVGVRL